MRTIYLGLVCLMIVFAKSVKGYQRETSFLYQSVFKSEKDTVLPIDKKMWNIKIVAVGDIMLGTNYPNNKMLPANNGEWLFKDADSIIRNATISFGNLEGTFLDSGGTPKGSGKNIYNFRQPTAYASILKSSGFDFLSIANNHINDFGKVGLSSTESVLKKNGLSFAGTNTAPYAIIEREGLKIGLVAFAPHSGAISFLDSQNSKNLVQDVKELCDILIVSFHGGAEGSNALHVTREKEIFLNQDRGNVYAFAHAMIDAGADIILGHGPHVPRALEVYKNKLIAYSLGNFCTYGMFNLKGVNGYAPILEFQVNGSGDFLNGKIISFLQSGEGGPKIDTTHLAAQLMQNLSKKDIPESKLIISDSGILSLSNR
jgi:poly-gamma-glutamate capsule biosynthesis protein CapA/YwtB (metallophosphatase superfamily)